MGRRSDRVYGLPEVRERRPRRRRTCLRCGRLFSTVIDRRCCRACTVVNAELQIGELHEAGTVFVRLQVGDA